MLFIRRSHIPHRGNEAADCHVRGGPRPRSAADGQESVCGRVSYLSSITALEKNICWAKDLAYKLRKRIHEEVAASLITKRGNPPQRKEDLPTTLHSPSTSLNQEQ
ncbi:hypothetical protein BaRGS_00037470 [Batillaria attramentaria]|uniref:Uncharacterized protein n=1 Tax=Batillaria attramentaria TaxID=370345 RepID=A0ABD0J9E5_9CAEN